MSFLLRTIPAARTTAARSVARFSTITHYQKSATETVKETLRAVDKTVSKAAADGIEAGRMLLLPPHACSLQAIGGAD
jgi:hypothetical protein